MVVPVSAGPVTVLADWHHTPDVLQGRWISVGSLVLILGLWALSRRKNRAQLK
jgi:hypothetical protein